MTTLHGIDVSVHQGLIDWSAVAGSGVSFAFVKATEGVGFEDPMFQRNRAVKAAGIVFGAYHFARPDLGNTPEDEADWFLAVAKPLPGELLALDFEVAYADPVTWCAAFLSRVKTLGFPVPLTYLNRSQLGLDWSPVISTGSGLWLAAYDENPDPISSGQWSPLAMKQYSSSGRVPGIGGRVDLDVFYGDRAALLRYGVKETKTMDSPQRMGQSADLVLGLGALGVLQGIYAYPAHPEGRAIVWKVRPTRIGRTIVTMYPPVDPDADATMLISAEPCIFVIDVLP